MACPSHSKAQTRREVRVVFWEPALLFVVAMNPPSQDKQLAKSTVIVAVVLIGAGALYVYNSGGLGALTGSANQNATQNPALERDKSTGLRYGKEYRFNRAIDKDGWNTPAMCAATLTFDPQGVTACYVMNNPGGVAVDQKSGEFVLLKEKTWTKGTALLDKEQNALVVLFGPGDSMPILQNAPYRIDGHSIYVDWSRGQTKYFTLARKYGASSEPEIMAIENDGMILKTVPGGAVFKLNLF